MLSVKSGRTTNGFHLSHLFPCEHLVALDTPVWMKYRTSPGRHHANVMFDVRAARSRTLPFRRSTSLLRLVVLFLMAVVHSSSTQDITIAADTRNTECAAMQPHNPGDQIGGAVQKSWTATSSSRKIYFQHIHKAGGTTMCAMAGLAKEIIGVKNCNSDPALGPANGLKEYARLRAEKHTLKLAGKPTTSVPAPGFAKTQQLLRGSRKEQCTFFANTPLTFIANEAPSPNTLLTVSGVFRFTMLRHPYDRHVSEFNHCLKKQCVGKFARSDIVLWLEGKRGTHANFQTRVILGDKSFNRPLVAEDIMLAKERLRAAYSLVLILEEFEPRGRLLL